MNKKNSSTVIKLIKIIIPILIALGISFITPPGELTVASMRFAGIFVCLIIWMVLNIWPDFVITLVGLCAFVIFGVCTFGDAFRRLPALPCGSSPVLSACRRALQRAACSSACPT